MKALKTLVAAAALAMSASTFASVLVLPGPETPLQTVINNMYQSLGCPTCSPVSAAPNVNANQAGAELFQIEASGASIATMIIEIAGNANVNSFGIYDPNNPSNFLQLFSGPQTGGSKSALTVDGSNTFTMTPLIGGPLVQTSATFSSLTFGYYLNGPNGIFYSQDSLNGGNAQLVNFIGDGDSIKLPSGGQGIWGSSSYILAWEDESLSKGSDQDYNDMVVYVESVTKVPEPGSLALLGLGLAGLAAVSRRKQKNT